MKHLVIQGQVKTKKDIQLVIDTLNIKFFKSVNQKEEIKEVQSLIKSQRLEGYKVNLFYFDTNVTDNSFVGYKENKGCLNWEYSTRNIGDLVTYLNCSTEDIVILKLKDLKGK